MIPAVAAGSEIGAWRPPNPGTKYTSEELLQDSAIELVSSSF